MTTVDMRGCSLRRHARGRFQRE